MRIAVIILIVLTVSACGVSRRTTSVPSSDQSPPAYAVSKYEELKASLMQAYRDWKGTPYQLGGTGESGVDCSSFVSIVFDDYFGIDLPMNTRRLLNEGEGIRRASVRTGDLVFFRTGRKTLHVGIVIEDERFLHASTSEGVTISNIEDRYWASRYLASRRIM